MLKLDRKEKILKQIQNCVEIYQFISYAKVLCDVSFVPHQLDISCITDLLLERTTEMCSGSPA